MIKLQHIMHASGSALRCNVSVNGEICTKTWRFKKKKKKRPLESKRGKKPTSSLFIIVRLGVRHLGKYQAQM